MSDSIQFGQIGSLAQSARSKQLKTARGILFFIGVMTIVVNLALVFAAESLVNSQIETELKSLRAQRMQVDQSKLAEFRAAAIRATRLADGIAVAIGVVFIVCGTLVYKYPIATTVTSLVLYLGCAAVYGAIDPMTLASGWLVKILIVVGLFKAVQAAIAYERDLKSARSEGASPETPELAFPRQ